jgi:hypothetical protein
MPEDQDLLSQGEDALYT